MVSQSRKIILNIFLSLALLIICVAIRPMSLTNNSGISYFGIHFSTVVPYAITFLINSYLYWHIAIAINKQSKINKLMSVALFIMSAMFIGLILTPYTYLSGLHEFFGSVLFSLQLILSLVITFLYKKWWFIAMTITELSSGILMFHYLPLKNGLLLQMQIIFQIAFLILLAGLFNIQKGTSNLHKISKSTTIIDRLI